MVTWAKYTGIPTRGKLIGLEIETESVEPYEVNEVMNAYWTVHNDGSLRFYGKEFVFKTPYEIDGPLYNKAFELFDALSKSQKFEESVYSSVHVHFNMEPLTLQQICNFISLYYLFEETLAEYCGTDRNGNLFCLKTSVAEYQANRAVELAKALQYHKNFSSVLRLLRMDALKYAGLNLATLPQLSTLEVRTHRGTVNVQEIKKWINILYCIYDACETFTDPKDILTFVNTFGFNTLFLKVFGEYSQFLSLVESYNGYWYVHEISKAVKDWSILGTLPKENTKVPLTKLYNQQAEDLLVAEEDEEPSRSHAHDLNAHIPNYLQAGYLPTVITEGDW